MCSASMEELDSFKLEFDKVPFGHHVLDDEVVTLDFQLSGFEIKEFPRLSRRPSTPYRGLAAHRSGFNPEHRSATTVHRVSPNEDGWKRAGEVTPSPPARAKSRAVGPMLPSELQRLAMPRLRRSDVGRTYPSPPAHLKPKPRASQPESTSHLQRLAKLAFRSGDVAVTFPTPPAHFKPQAIEPVSSSVLQRLTERGRRSCDVDVAHSKPQAIEPVSSSVLQRSTERGRRSCDVDVARLIDEVRSSVPPFSAAESCKIHMGLPKLWVLFGRSPRCYKHPGNYFFLKVVIPHFRDLYESVSKVKKTLVAQHVVDAVLATGGLFVDYAEDKDDWVQVPDEVARKKASQALREKTRTPEERKQKRLMYPKNKTKTPMKTNQRNR